MAKSQLRVFHIDGREVSFYTDAFSEAFRAMKRSQGKSFEALAQEMAEAIHVSVPTIKSWRYHQSGPGSIELISDAAEFLGLEAEDLLLERKAEMQQEYTDRQLEAARRIYVAIVDFLSEFEETDGFNDYWFPIRDSGVPAEKVQGELYELVEKKHAKVRTAAKREAFDLHGTQLYEAFMEYIDGILMDIWDYPKLAYAYRFEEPVGWYGMSDEEIEASKDINRANRALQEIIENYM